MLIEAGFITNDSDVKQIQARGGDSLANQMANAIDKAVKVKKEDQK